MRTGGAVWGRCWVVITGTGAAGGRVACGLGGGGGRGGRGAARGVCATACAGTSHPVTRCSARQYQPTGSGSSVAGGGPQDRGGRGAGPPRVLTGQRASRRPRP